MSIRHEVTLLVLDSQPAVKEPPKSHTSLGVGIRTKKPPLGYAKHIYKKIGALYETRKDANSKVGPEEQKRIDEANYAT